MTPQDLEEMFDRLRFDPAHHLGAGDIRLTLGQQEEIVRSLVRPEAGVALDAARYRWLRENGRKSIFVLNSGWKRGDDDPPLVLAQGESLDGAIDLYLKGEALPQKDER